MRLPDHILEQIKNAANIVSVIESHGVKLQKRGTVYRACCPFHHEDTPSFTVDPRKQTYKCFGASCGKSGDVINFIEEYNRLDFKQAVQYLANYLHLSHLLPRT